MRERQLDLPEDLPRGRAEGLPGLDQLGLHLPDAEVGQAHQRRQREDDRRDHRRHDADAEEHHDRHQIDEGRDGLHDVEERPQHRRPAVAAGGEDAERDADDQAEDHRRHDHRQRHHGLRPEAEPVEQQERAGGEEREPSPAGAPGGAGGKRDDHHEGCREQQRLQRVEHPLDRPLHARGRSGGAPGSASAHGALDPVVERQRAPGRGAQQHRAADWSRLQISMALSSLRRGDDAPRCPRR